MANWIRTTYGDLINLDLVRSVTLHSSESWPMVNGEAVETWEYRPVAEFSAYPDAQVILVDKWLDKETADFFMAQLSTAFTMNVRNLDAAAILANAVRKAEAEKDGSR